MAPSPEEKAALDAAARQAIVRAGIRLGRLLVRKDGEPVDVMAEYGKALAFALIWRRQIERLGHTREVAELSAEIRRIINAAPPLDFAESAAEPSDPDDEC